MARKSILIEDRKSFSSLQREKIMYTFPIYAIVDVTDENQLCTLGYFPTRFKAVEALAEGPSEKWQRTEDPEKSIIQVEIWECPLGFSHDRRTVYAARWIHMYDEKTEAFYWMSQGVSFVRLTARKEKNERRSNARIGNAPIGNSS